MMAGPAPATGRWRERSRRLSNATIAFILRGSGHLVPGRRFEAVPDSAQPGQQIFGAVAAGDDENPTDCAPESRVKIDLRNAPSFMESLAASWAEKAQQQ